MKDWEQKIIPSSWMKCLKELIANYPNLGRSVENREEKVFVKDIMKSIIELIKIKLKFCIYGIAEEIQRI